MPHTLGLVPTFIDSILQAYLQRLRLESPAQARPVAHSGTSSERETPRAGNAYLPNVSEWPVFCRVWASGRV